MIAHALSILKSNQNIITGNYTIKHSQYKIFISALTELGIPAEELDAAAERCIANAGGQIKGFMTLDATAIREIFTLAR